MRRRGRGEGSIYRRDSDGRWVSVLNLGVVNGKRKRKVIYGTTRREVARKLTEAARDERVTAVTSTNLSVAGWLDWWLGNVATDRLKPPSIVSYRSRIETHIKPAIGAHRLDRLAVEHVIAMQRDLLRRGFSLATRQHIHTVLRIALRDAHRMEKVRRNVTDLMDPPKGERTERAALAHNDMLAVLRAADESDRPARWYAALHLGLRQSEALGLRWSDVDLDTAQVRIRRALQRRDGGGLTFAVPKSRASLRTVPLPMKVLSRFRVEHARHLNADGKPDDLVWARANGAPMSPQTDWRQWRDLLAIAGVPPAPLHAARTTAASLLMASDVADRVAAELLGHANVRLTQDVYQRGDPEQHRRAMAALEAYTAE